MVHWFTVEVFTVEPTENQTELTWEFYHLFLVCALLTVICFKLAIPFQSLEPKGSLVQHWTAPKYYAPVIKLPNIVKQGNK